MTARIVNLGSSEHQLAQDLLPWFVMGTLDDEDRAAVEEHLQICAACRREMPWHEQLREAHADVAPLRDVDRAFAALRLRLPAAAFAPSVATRWRAWWQRQRPQSAFGGWALALQSLIIVALAVALLIGRNPVAADTSPQFHALGRSSDAAPPSRLVVVFAPQVAQAEMRRVLLASGTRIVDGPTAADAYILAVAQDHAEQALEQLRGEKSVLLVQSLDSGVVH